MSVLDEFQRRQQEQLELVGQLERRAERVRVLREQEDAESREYAKEWAAAKRLDVSESMLKAAGLPVPDAPARSRPGASRSGKKAGGQPEVLGGASVSDADG